MPKSQMCLALRNGSFVQPNVLTNRIMQFVSDPAYSASTPHLVPEFDMSGVIFTIFNGSCIIWGLPIVFLEWHPIA